MQINWWVKLIKKNEAFYNVVNVSALLVAQLKRKFDHSKSELL